MKCGRWQCEAIAHKGLSAFHLYVRPSARWLRGPIHPGPPIPLWILCPACPVYLCPACVLRPATCLCSLPGWFCLNPTRLASMSLIALHTALASTSDDGRRATDGGVVACIVQQRATHASALPGSSQAMESSMPGRLMIHGLSALGRPAYLLPLGPAGLLGTSPRS